MPGDLHIRPATAADTDRILDLVKLSLGEGRVPRHTGYWTWKHARNPFGPSPCLLAEADGRLVGLRVFMRWDWRARGITVPAVRAVDTATHPDWRGRGIFTRLTLALLGRLKAEGIAFVFNTPNSQSRPGYLKMGWLNLGRTSLWVRPLRPLRLASTMLRSRGIAPGDPNTGVEIGDPASDLLGRPGFSQFLASLAEREDRLSTPRTHEYLRWRYGEIPDLAYRTLSSVEGDQGAVVIFRYKERGRVRELRLCEVLIGSTEASRRMGRDLLRSLRADARADFATVMTVTGSPERSILLRCGFLPAPRSGPILTVHPLNRDSTEVDPLRRGDWDLSIGDLELF